MAAIFTGSQCIKINLFVHAPVGYLTVLSNVHIKCNIKWHFGFRCGSFSSDFCFSNSIFNQNHSCLTMFNLIWVLCTRILATCILCVFVSHYCQIICANHDKKCSHSVSYKICCMNCKITYHARCVHIDKMTYIMSISGTVNIVWEIYSCTTI